MEKRSPYMRGYMHRRYQERRARALKLLGGVCMSCGTGDDLEIDHKDPTLKKYTVAQFRTISEEDFLAEVAKCQLLCKEHHTEKSIVDAGKVSAKGTHGTLSSYRYCKCDLCRSAANKYNNKRRREKRELAKENPAAKRTW